MYYIKKSEWEKMEKSHSDYCGKSINNPEIHVIFEGAIPGNNGKGGTNLLFEGKHFEIVDDGKFNIEKMIKDARFANPVNTTKLEYIKEKYGADIYKEILNKVLTEEKEIDKKLFTASCNGEIEVLQEYYNNGGKIGRSYERFGISHSLIAGAWRNGNFDVVHYLLSVGENPMQHEYKEIILDAIYYIDKTIHVLEDLKRCFYTES